jgi:hypothetical protein
MVRFAMDCTWASSQPIVDSRFVQGLAAGPRSKTAPCSPQDIAVDIAK